MKTLFLILALSILSILAKAQWWPDVRLTEDEYDSGTSQRRCVASSEDTVHVVWGDDRNDYSSCFYIRSIDAGWNWYTEIQLNDGFHALYPSVTVQGPIVHVALCGVSHEISYYEIYYKRSIDGGNTWGDTARMISFYTGHSFHPELTTSGQYVYIAWYEQCEDWWEVFFCRSFDYGTSWESAQRITNDPNISARPTIAASGPTVHLAWHDSRDGNREIYYKRSDDYGQTWGTDTRLTYSLVDARYPESDLTGDTLHLVWRDERDGNREIYYKRSLDGGLSWDENIRLTNDPGESDNPSITASGACVYVVWNDMRYGISQVFYKCSFDAGNTWSPDSLLTKQYCEATRPSADIANYWLHIVWTDTRDNNSEIYCKSKYLENFPTGLPGENIIISDHPAVLFSNPASDHLYYELQGASHQNIRLEIFDINGRCISRHELKSNRGEISLNGLKSGAYFVKIKTDRYETVRKIVRY